MSVATAATPDSIRRGQEPRNGSEFNDEPPMGRRIHSHVKTRRSSEHWCGSELQESVQVFDGKTRAARNSIAYIPTPRASRGFHEHDGQRVFDEEFLEQLKLHRQRSRFGKPVKRFSLRSMLDSFRGPSTAAAPVRFSFSRTMKHLRRHLQWRIANLSQPISPEGTLNCFREFVVFGVLVFQVFYTPFAPIYLNDGVRFQRSQITINIAMELVLLGTTVLNFNTSTYDAKRMTLIESRREIARRYLRTSFVPDLLGSLPLEFFNWLSSSRADGDNRTLAAIHPNAYIVENLFHFLWIRQLRRFGWSSWVRVIRETIGKTCQTLCGANFSVLAVSAKLFVGIAIAAHYLACVFRCILNSSQIESTSETPGALYTRDLLQVVSTLFGNGWETGHRQTDAFSVFLVLIGAMVTACITSRVAMEMLLGASSTNTLPSSDAKPPRKGKRFEPVSTSVLQHRALPRKLSKLGRMPAEPISFNTQRSAFCESAARTVESSASKWSEAPPEPAPPSLSSNNEVSTVGPKLLDTSTSSNAAETEILQLLRTFATTVQRVETKLDTLSLNRSKNAAPTPAAIPKLHRSRSVQGDGSMHLSKNPAAHPRSIRCQRQERQVPT